jgi:hypothetical protein
LDGLLLGKCNADLRQDIIDMIYPLTKNGIIPEFVANEIRSPFLEQKEIANFFRRFRAIFVARKSSLNFYKIL